MRKQVFAVVGVFVVALALAGSLAWASNAVKVDVPFSFIVNEKTLPAGQYQIEPAGSNMSQLAIRGSGGTTIAKVVERLADTGGKEPKVVFDKVEGKFFLSEVHYPGSDGYLVGSGTATETHEVITGKP
jgi:hypothetical protein